MSKMITSNLYAIIQCVLFVIYFGIGVLVRRIVTGTSLTGSLGESTTKLLNAFVESGMLSNILKCLPFIIIMILLSFFAYSLLAGILASMTTNIEDYQQLQTPLMIILMVGYYIAIMASAFEGAIFVKIVAYVPMLSFLVAPVIYLLGQISLLELILSTVICGVVTYLFFYFGLRIYKVGILNYSSQNLWKKIFKSIKEK